MRPLRYTLLCALLIPGAALAQVVGETNAILSIAGNEHAVFANQNFGAQFENGIEFGPHEIVQSTGPAGNGTTLDGCEPFENADDIAGNIALISRGACAFVLKAENAFNAGAVAYIVYMDEREGQEGETLVNMGGDCEEAVCGVPGVFMSRRDYKAILPDVKFGEEASIAVEFSDLPSVGEVATGVMNLPIYDNGFFGAVPENNYAPVASELPFTFNGFTPLRIGSVLVGIDGNVVGSPYAEASEYVRNGTVLTGTVNDGRDQAAQARFRSDELGIEVTNLTYGISGDPLILLQVSAVSTTGETIEDVYLGLFADWDIIDDPDDTSEDDLAAVEPFYGLAYVYDQDRAQFYGVISFDLDALQGFGNPSGYTTESDGSESALWSALTTETLPSDIAAARAIVIGNGPFTLPGNGEPVVRTYALLAGATEHELLGLANPCSISAVFCPSVETTTEAGTYRLASVYPNPVSTTAQVGFTLPTAEQARVEVYDLLGRRVAVVAEGVRPAGTHTVTLDVTGLPSGVYVVRLATPSVALTERVTVVR
ncbi:MAG: PA domain-containing protein [Bacteroidota bacterium]